MRITDLLDKRSISLDGASKKKREALDMAIDMGGPFNKATYVFGTAAIAAGNYDIMAAVMIGGMVPPCAIALATLLFKDKFTKEERNPICGSRSDSCTSGMYLLALVVGTIVSAILLGVLKKKVA